jgi:N-acetylmuramoyl-L-alanine amidase
MLDPAGDARSVGRTIDDYFERSISFAFAKQIKYELEKKYDDLKVILTRLPGQIIEPLQNQNFANRMGVNLYVSIHFFQLPTQANQATYVYYLLHDPVTDFWKTDSTGFQFIPYHHAHRINLEKTAKIAQQFCACFAENPVVGKALHGPHGIPFRPLMGLSCAAVAIEIGLHKEADCTRYLEPITQAIACAMECL